MSRTSVLDKRIASTTHSYLPNTIVWDSPQAQQIPCLEVARSSRQGQTRRACALPAVSIALVDDQRLVWSKGFGHQDAAGTVPATDATVYRVGSVSKLFTDIAIVDFRSLKASETENGMTIEYREPIDVVESDITRI